MAKSSNTKGIGGEPPEFLIGWFLFWDIPKQVTPGVGWGERWHSVSLRTIRVESISESTLLGSEEVGVFILHTPSGFAWWLLSEAFNPWFFHPGPSASWERPLSGRVWCIYGQMSLHIPEEWRLRWQEGTQGFYLNLWNSWMLPYRAKTLQMWLN